MNIREHCQPLSLVCVAAASAALAAPAQAAPKLQPEGWHYVEDEFSDQANSNAIWFFASCSRTPHGTTSKNAPNTQFKTFGMAARPGYCGIQSRGLNRFLRFITMPFDRRDAIVTYKADGSVASDNFSEMDDGKGGSEMRSRPTFAYDGAAHKHGWDLFGQNYLTPTNTVRFTWKFRLYDVSMIRRIIDGDRLASSAVVGQFHSQPLPECNSKGRYNAAFSPAPGLDVRVEPGPDGSEHVFFKLFTKITNSQVPSGVPKCSAVAADADEACNVKLWEESFPLAKVTRTEPKDVRMPPWITVSYVMRPSRTNGALKFVFGVENSNDAALAYQNRPLNGAGENRFVLHIPMTQNNCPNKPFVGAYVLGFDRKYYGYLHKDGNNHTPRRIDQKPSQSTWVHPNLLKNRRLKSYIDGTWAADDYPPEFVVDYDDFRIIQMPPLPEKGLELRSRRL